MTIWRPFSLVNQGLTVQQWIKKAIDIQGLTGEHIGEQKPFSPGDRGTD
jgi:hypothetical protein